MLSFPPMRPPWEDLEPASRSAVERQRHAATRVEQFATVVFGVSLALPAILLFSRLPASVPQIESIAEVVQTISPALGTCAVAILAVLCYWFIHHLEFHYLTRSSGALLLLHAFLLPSLLFVPFSAELLTLRSLTGQSLLFFVSNLLVVQVLLLLMWRHSVKAGLLFGGDVPRRVVLRVRLLLGGGVAGLVVVFGLSLVNAPLGLGTLVFLLVAQIGTIARGGYTLDLHSVVARTPAD